MAALHELSAAEMAAAYAAGSISPVEVARATIAHIEACEPKLHAMYAFDPEGALSMARASEARWQQGAPCSVIDGAPVTIKENIATRGVPVPMGTAASVLTPAAEDAPPAARMREAGAVFLGKTTMPDFGMLSSGLSSFHPLTRNPWDLRKNPGGSSAGAGAAAAAGYGPLHIGTDIGGSVRLPAGWCGVFGLKPSLGRIPIKPPYYGRVAGPMTRTVHDAALMMVHLAKPDARDSMSLPAQHIDWMALDIDVSKLKIGLLLDAGWGEAVDPQVRATVEAAARAFAAAGAEVEPLRPFVTREMADGIDRFFRMRSWLDISALPDERRSKVLPYIRDWVAAGAHYSGAQVFHAFSQIGALREASVLACQPYDYVLSPVAPMVAFDAELPGPSNDPERPFEHIAFTLTYNMSEQPAASVNAGYSEAGLPIGLQIIGKRFDDLGVLRMAQAWERMRPAQRNPPAPDGVRSPI
jgi:aspartyl-tRNA(Asn)/glutamyl-tRNA(Gln) amidotransferase subunit A